MKGHRHARLNPEAIARLTANTEPWLSYEECFEQLDSVIEGLVATGTPLSQKVRVHLLACPFCYDEAVSLAALVADDLGLSPDDAVARLDTAVLGAQE